MNKDFQAYYHCPNNIARIEVSGELSPDSGFFEYGQDTVCYGQLADGSLSQHLPHKLCDASEAVRFDGGTLQLPFDLSQVIDNLRCEHYYLNGRFSIRKIIGTSILRKFYYLFRPLLPVSIRKYLQKVYLLGWDKIIFPNWPVDFTVESVMEHTMASILKGNGGEPIPFIWYWPEGAPSCAMMTHDVEAQAGHDFCSQLMDWDDAFGIKSAFQIVPEVRYATSKLFLENLRTRGFEVNVHDLNHDGSLFREKEEFLRRAEKINRYLKEFHTEGFRAGAMYRNQEWYDSLNISYDMSVPNVAHLEPQRGGCCTVMPYFIGKILELPLTTAQDYHLFHIMGDYSIDLWKQQIDMILKRNGLISFIVHPDYVIDPRAQEVYLDLLGHLARLRAERKLWVTLPAEVNRWWRNRSQMKLTQENGVWRIDGPDKERARLAYATLEGDRVVYTVENSPSLRDPVKNTAY